MAFGVIIVGVVGTMGFYMPYRSPQALANRKRVAGLADADDDPSKMTPQQKVRAAGGASNNMWKNLERHKRK